jgi:guanylate kinase
MSNIFIISGPSGAGEDSVINGLEKYFKIRKIINTTSRKAREGEKEGLSYYFIDKIQFEKMIENKDFAEYAQHYNGNYYGVTNLELERVSETGDIALWKMDYKGVITIKKKFPQIKSIYIAPPSLEIIKNRIIRRDPNINEEFLKERMEYTKEWMKNEHIYDFKVVNEEGKLDETIGKVADIINQNR